MLFFLWQRLLCPTSPNPLFSALIPYKPTVSHYLSAHLPHSPFMTTPILLQTMHLPAPARHMLIPLPPSMIHSTAYHNHHHHTHHIHIRPHPIVPQYPTNLHELTFLVHLRAKFSFVALLSKFPEVIAQHDKDIGTTDIFSHDITLTQSAPVRQAARRLSPTKSAIVKTFIDDMLKHDIIEPSTSPYASPIVLVEKPDGSHRFSVDYRKLNGITQKGCLPFAPY